MFKTGLLLLPGLLVTMGGINSAYAQVTFFDKDQWKISLSGFVETDGIVDSTRSFTEVVGNNPVVRSDTVNGQTGRAQLSIRNSRLAFTVDTPPPADDWRAKAYMEFDLLGFNPSPGATNTEAALYNSPTFRVRHAYAQSDHDGFTALLGQYWELFGWQPYYFMPSVGVAPLPGMVYVRTAQLRGLKTLELREEVPLQVAISFARPPERDSGLPDIQAGARIAYDGRTSAFTGGATGAHKPQPASLGVSGVFREFVIPQNPVLPNSNVIHFPGTAIAIDALIPVLASPDGQDVSNNFSISGEFTTGTGYGDQFAGFTGGLANPLNSVATAPDKNVNLDGGLGGFDAFGNFRLVQLNTFNLNGQYHLPAQTRTWFSAGYGRLFSDNVDRMTQLQGANAGKTSAGNVPYNRVEVFYGNVFRDLTAQLRLGFEYAYFRTNYVDGLLMHDTRCQLSAWFIF